MLNVSIRDKDLEIHPMFLMNKEKKSYKVMSEISIPTQQVQSSQYNSHLWKSNIIVHLCTYLILYIKQVVMKHTLEIKLEFEFLSLT